MAGGDREGAQSRCWRAREWSRRRAVRAPRGKRVRDEVSIGGEPVLSETVPGMRERRPLWSR